MSTISTMWKNHQKFSSLTDRRPSRNSEGLWCLGHGTITSLGGTQLKFPRWECAGASGDSLVSSITWANNDWFVEFNHKKWWFNHKRWWFIERKPNIGLSFGQFLWQHWISEAEHVQKASLIGTWTLSATSSQGFCWWNCGHGYPSGNQTWPWNWDIPYKRRWFFLEKMV